MIEIINSEGIIIEHRPQYVGSYDLDFFYKEEEERHKEANCFYLLYDALPNDVNKKIKIYIQKNE